MNLIYVIELSSYNKCHFLIVKTVVTQYNLTVELIFSVYISHKHETEQEMQTNNNSTK